jgi:hypothetical protein
MKPVKSGYVFEITHRLPGQMPVMIVEENDEVLVYLKDRNAPMRVTGDAVERNEEGEVARVNMRLSPTGNLTWFNCEKVKVGRSF